MIQNCKSLILNIDETERGPVSFFRVTLISSTTKCYHYLKCPFAAINCAPSCACCAKEASYYYCARNGAEGAFVLGMVSKDSQYDVVASTEKKHE